ncbi:hypothetical protein HOA92_04010 [archaeon]|jgi:hypothetical protein|nr:hypothetical protein [archaeon]MBT6762178.1 hypothetical protein [archaeon]
MGLTNIIDRAAKKWVTVDVMSYRYLREVAPILDKNEHSEDYANLIENFEGKDPIHIIPKSLKDKMKPVTRTAYETVKEAAGVSLFTGYQLGRVMRESNDIENLRNTFMYSNKTDIRVNDLLFPGHAGHAATELYFHHINKPVSALGKTVGFAVGTVLSPFAIAYGLKTTPHKETAK